VNEVFRQKVLGGSGYDRAAKPFTSSTMLIDYVGHTRGALGIVGLDWLKDHDAHVTVLGVASPAMRPDSTFAPDEYYTPVQAYVYLGYYPISTPVYIYSREVERDLGDGFIAFVTSVAGQKVVQAGGLVPATMPVRLVQLTSRQVQ
jgi:phosphate transport system substrate-binding protein